MMAAGRKTRTDRARPPRGGPRSDIRPTGLGAEAPAESLGLPTSTPRGVAFFNAFTARVRSPSTWCVLLHGKSKRVVETTYLALASSFVAQARSDAAALGSRATRGQAASISS